VREEESKRVDVGTGRDKGEEGGRRVESKDEGDGRTGGRRAETWRGDTIRRKRGEGRGKRRYTQMRGSVD
jgi:hypothetical protein